VTKDHTEIVSAVLTAQPDLASQHREFVAEYPSEASWFDGFFDYRLCVARETAGTSGDFERTDWEVDAPRPDFDLYRRRWEQSASRHSIANDLLPAHLRWDAAFSFCPRGLLRIGNPNIQGDSATVYVENTSSVRGWAGEVELIRTGDEWTVKEEHIWRQS